MTRSLEEILNTPVEFKVGMRVFILHKFNWGEVDGIHRDNRYDYPIIVKQGPLTYTFSYNGKFEKTRPYRGLLTEQEAYELFPSLKPKVYEYQVVYKYGINEGFMLSNGCYTCESDFKERNPDLKFIELYQPSKRERKL